MTGAVKMELQWLRMAGGRVVSPASSAGSVSLQVWASSATSVSSGSSSEFCEFRECCSSSSSAGSAGLLQRRV